MSNLLAIRGANIGVRYELGDETTIGRAPDNAIQVPDPNISRLHCRILRRGNQWRIVDAGSKNGIYVNGNRVKEADLQADDEVRMGATAFLYNTDHDLKNTRFSNKLVYFSSPGDEEIKRLRIGEMETPGPDSGMPPLGSATDLLCQIGNLFASELPLPESLERILRTLLNVFGARDGCLLTWEPVAREFVPMVVVSESPAFTVSLAAVRTVLEEKQTVLVPTRPSSHESLTQAMGIDESGANPTTPGGVCVPLLKGERVTGLIYLETESQDALLLHDVVLLQAVANLTRTAIEQAQQIDRLTRKGESSEVQAPRLIGQSAEFLNTLELVDKVADSDSTVLLTGETGTGKEMIAREIHRRSGRKNYPFCAINCAAMPESLIESELFGHEKGAFTGAAKMRQGLIETAHGGTLFLDEIGEMTLAAQTKLLRFLQDHVIVRVGGHQPIVVDVRVVAATNADLEKAVQAKRFREDLWYRINVFEISLPPLRMRKQDVQALAEYFLERYAQTCHKTVLGIDPEALDAMRAYRWPGNVREMQNAIERAVLLCDGPYLLPQHLNLQDAQTPSAERTSGTGRRSAEILPLHEVERRHILDTLERVDWNQARASRRLQIHRNTLRKKINDYGLRTDDGD